MADRADDIIGAVRAGARTTADAVAVTCAVNTAALQGAITAAIDRGAARDGPLDPDDTVTVLDNLRDNPLTAQLVAQGRLKPQDVLAIRSSGAPLVFFLSAALARAVFTLPLCRPAKLS